MKRLLGLFLVLLLTPFLNQPLAAQEVKKATVLYQFDVDSGTENFVKLTGADGTVFGADRVVQTAGAKISTSGSSTTVSATTALTVPFADLGVGDIILVKIGPDAAPSIRYITAKASGDSVTVNTAIDLSADATGYFFKWRKKVSGTTAADGWFDVSTLSPLDRTITVQYDQGDLDALLVRWQCRVRSLDTQPVTVYPGESDGCGTGGTLASGFCSFATAGVDSRLAVVVGGKWDECRVGLKFAASDASDAGANLEQVTVTVYGSLGASR